MSLLTPLPIGWLLGNKGTLVKELWIFGLLGWGRHWLWLSDEAWIFQFPEFLKILSKKVQRLFLEATHEF